MYLDEDKGTSSGAIAKLFLWYVWSKHGLPMSMRSDRGPQFVSKMWDSLCKLFDINAKLSTTFHSETDGQNKNANQDMERHLRSYVNHFQNDWIELPAIAKFSGNANTLAIIKISPFLASQGVVPQMSFDLVDFSALSTHKQLANATAKSRTDWMQNVWNFMRAEMTKWQDVQAAKVNWRQKNSPTYEVGNLMWLSTRNIKTERPLKKLDHKMIGPYKIEILVRSSYWLKLPITMKIHNVFHPNLLQKAATDPLPGQCNKPEPLTIIDDEKKFVVVISLMQKRYEKEVKRCFSG